MLEWSIADQAAGGQGLDTRYTCITNGMPRMMAVIQPIEFVILPNITYVHFEAFMPRRIYTDGRDFPKDDEPSFAGYSIGKWSDTDGDGRFDTLEVETRNFKGPRTVEFSGIPLHEDNQTVVKEKISLDKSNPDLMHNIITIIDNAFTRPWTVDKRYRRDRNVMWFEDNCTENNHHVVIGKENYFVSARRLSHAGTEKSGSAGFALLQCRRQIAAAHRPKLLPIRMRALFDLVMPSLMRQQTLAHGPATGETFERSLGIYGVLHQLSKRRGDLFRRISASSTPF